MPAKGSTIVLTSILILNVSAMVWVLLDQQHTLSRLDRLEAIQNHPNVDTQNLKDAFLPVISEFGEYSQSIERLNQFLHSEMTPEVQTKLELLANQEQQLQMASNLPSTENDATAACISAEQAFSTLPVWVQDEWLPRATRIQWALGTLADIRRYQTVTADNAESAEFRLQTQWNSQPEQAPAAVVRLLGQCLANVRKCEKQFAIDAAQKITASDTDDEISAAYTQLSRYSDDPSISPLLAALVQRKETIAVNQQCDALRARMKVAEGCTDLQLRETYLGEIYQAAAAAKLDLLSQIDFAANAMLLDPILQECARQSDATAYDQMKAQLVRQTEAHKNYQKWGVEQIQAFWRYEKAAAVKSINSTLDAYLHDASDNTAHQQTWEMAEFPEFRAAIKSVAGIDLADTSISPEQQKHLTDSNSSLYGLRSWQHVDELAYAVHRAAAIKYLLPLDEKFLDPPVAALYDDALTKARDELDSDDKVEFARQCALVDKTSPDQLMTGDRQ